MKKLNVITVFPKGTIVKFAGIPCELLEEVSYQSATALTAEINRKQK